MSARNPEIPTKQHDIETRRCVDRGFEVTLGMNGELLGVLREGAPVTHTVLPKLYDLHQYITRRYEPLTLREYRSPAGRQKISSYIEFWNKIIDSVPNYLAANFATDTQRPKERALLEKIRLELIVQREELNRQQGLIDYGANEVEDLIADEMPFFATNSEPATQTAPQNTPASRERSAANLRLPPALAHIIRVATMISILTATGSSSSQTPSRTEIQPVNYLGSAHIFIGELAGDLLELE